jgi:hypothetical protein
LVTTSDE